VRSGENSDMITLVTSGMSNWSLHGLPDEEDLPKRVELVFYLVANKPDTLEWIDRIIGWMDFVAKFPYRDKTWIGHGHTIFVGEPLAPDSSFRHFMLLETPLKTDRSISDIVVIDGDPVSFLWLVPITDAEREYKVKHGSQKLLSLFDEKKHPWIFTGNRESYV